MKTSTETSREPVYTHTLITHTSKNISQNTPARVFLSLVSALPAVLCGCIPEESAPVEATTVTAVRVSATRSAGASAAKTLDIFAFNDDRLQRLDAYIRYDDFSGETAEVASQAGDKIMFFCANGQRERYSWADVNCLASLDGIHADLEKEDPAFPVMTACCRTTAGKSPDAPVELKPLMSCITLNSLSCDFSGMSYEDATIKDVKAYLTNVNAGCSLTADGRILPQRIINAGMLNEDDMDEFRTPEMVSCGIASEIGKEMLRPSVSLYCYPNMSGKEGPGTPFTRLVIEGTIDGTTYYWPVNVNRSGDEGVGIGRNCRYIYDMTIRRKGSLSPDIPIEATEADIRMTVRQWNEKEGYPVTFGEEEYAQVRVYFKEQEYGTRSQNPDEELIRDANILVFDSCGDVLTQEWIQDAAAPEGRTIRLLKNLEHTICACVNFGYAVQADSFDELCAMRHHLAYPDEYREGMPMFACLEDVTIEEDGEILLEPVRLMAKVSLSIDRSRLTEDVDMDVVYARIGNCPRSVRLRGPSMVHDAGGCFSTGFSLDDGQCQPLNTNVQGMTSGEVSLYMLENMQGAFPQQGIEDCEKIFDEDDSRAATCSYIELGIDYMSEDCYSRDGNLIYRFYLGGSASDLDIERNCHYHITVTPEDDGLSDGGWRVDKSSLVPHDEESEISRSI